jgi:hypothetical protein
MPSKWKLMLLMSRLWWKVNHGVKRVLKFLHLSR